MGDRLPDMPLLPPDRWTEADALFDAALQRPPDERTAWLRATCGDDPALYHAVTALLDADTEAEAALGESATVFAAGLLDAVERDAEVGLPAGTRVGAYEVVDELGRGGMGAVYRAARADGTFEKEVALKLVKRGMDTDEVLRRFRAERQILAGLDHPNVARLLDAGAHDDGRPFLVMERVEGEPITAYADARRLGVEARLDLFEQVVEAVAYAHRRLVVHRYLKPSNVLVAVGDSGDGASGKREGGDAPSPVPLPASPTVKLLDFGIARLLDPEADALTRPEMRVLTPEYAAPEQVRGEALTTAADVYALGVVLYELLVGARPGGPDPATPSAAVTEAAASARGTTADRLARTLRGDLDTLTLAALRADPERRYASADALLDDLRRYRQRLPLRARPESATYRMGRFVARHRLGVGLGAAALALLLGGSAFTSARVSAERDAARAERDRAEATAAFVTGLFDAADPFVAPTERPDTLRARDLLLRGAGRAQAALGDQPATRADVLTTVGEALVALGLYTEADSVLGRAVAAAREAGTAGSVAYALTAQGRARSWGDAPAEAVASLREALAEADAPKAAASARFHLGAALRRAGELDEAATVLAAARADDREPLDAASVRIELGRVEQDRGRPADAEPLFREALTLQQAALPADHPTLAEAHEMVGAALQDQGRLDEAEPSFQEAYRVRQAALGDDHAQTQSARYNLAALHRDMGRFDEAVRTFRALTVWDREHLGPDHPYVGYNLLQLGITHGRAEQPDSAIAAYRDALDVLQRTLPESHPAVSEAMGGIGYEMTRSGRAREGEPMLRRVLEIRREALGADSWRTGVSESTLGECLLRQGRTDEAERHLVAGYETIRAASGPEGAALRRLVELYETTGRDTEAAPYRERLAEIERA
ncbi:MAG: serine/threonine-protein kinase [Bacteroidota bacterium]